jgi:hypothetical protein
MGLKVVKKKKEKFLRLEPREQGFEKKDQNAVANTTQTTGIRKRKQTGTKKQTNEFTERRYMINDRPQCYITYCHPRREL